MPKTDNHIALLIEIVGSDHVMADQDKLKGMAVDGLVPACMVSPGSLAETSKVMAAAHAHGLAVLPIGGRTKMSLGGIPKRADILLSTRRMNGFNDYDISNLSIEVECGATVAEVQAKLRAEGEGYILPIDPPHKAGATIGGVVAANDNGPRRLLYGGLRDVILGNTTVLANGDIVHSGGKVMKNVASYDLTKLMIGSLGSLGVICRTTFRIYLKSESETTLFVSFAGLKEAESFIRRVTPAFYYPAALELLNAQAAAACGGAVPVSGAYVAAVGLEGIVEAVERQIADMTEMGVKEGALGTSTLKEGGHRAFWDAYSNLTDGLKRDHPDAIVLKSNFAISRHAEMMVASERVMKKAGFACALACHAGSGILYTVLLTGRDSAVKKEAILVAIEELTAEAVKNEGNLVVEQAPVFVKEKVSVWGRIGGGFKLMRGLKDRFDPDGVINPGRYVGGI